MVDSAPVTVDDSAVRNSKKPLVGPAGLEPATLCLVLEVTPKTIWYSCGFRAEVAGQRLENLLVNEGLGETHTAPNAIAR